LRVCAVLLVYAVRELRLRLSQVSAVLNAHAEVQLFGYTLFKPTFVNGSASAGLTSFCCFDQFLLDWPVWLVYPFAGLPIYWFLHCWAIIRKDFRAFWPSKAYRGRGRET
jgi:hypothetical protein